MAWDRGNGNAEAMPNTREIDRLPPYQAATDEGKPPAYTVRPPSISELVPPTESTRPTESPWVAQSNSHDTPPDESPQQSRKRTRRSFCLWFRWLIFAACIAGGVFAGLFVGLVVKKRHKNNDDSATNTPVLPPTGVYDLAATECEPGTFIFNQDMFGEVWVRGDFHNAMWRNSSSMPPLMLHLVGTFSPQKPSNMTAVCWSVPELDIARIALYFVSPFPDPVTKYAIIETIVDIYTTNFTLVEYPAFSDTHRMVTRVLEKSSLVAVVLPSEGVRLYYQEKPKDSKKFGISELSRGWPTPPLNFQDSIQASRHLDVDAHSTGTPLTAAAVDTNDGTRPAEVHIFFVDKKSRLSRVLRVGSETYPPQPLAERVNSGGWTIPMQRMTAIIPHINNGVPEPDLFFIWSERVTDIFGAVEIPSGYTAANAPFVYIQNSGSARLEADGTSTMPEAVQTPPLIAVTCWNFRDNRTMGVDAGSTAENKVRMQIFYVKLDKGPYGSDRAYDNMTRWGDGIVRVTARAVPFVGYTPDWDEGNNTTTFD